MQRRHNQPRDHAGHASAAHPPRPSRPKEGIDLFDEDAGESLAAALTSPTLDSATGLNSKVLVLNRLYVAIRVISARRAFCLLMRDIAEVIHVETPPHAAAEPAPAPDGATIDTLQGARYVNYDFASWADLSVLRHEFERDRFDWVRTPRVEIAVPRIIRLLGYDRLPDQSVKLNRRNLFARDRSHCQYCGRHYPTHELSIDHVTPRAHGGKDTWENLVCACIRCNARKGGRTPDQAGMRLIRKPERPRRNPIISLRLGNEKYRSWRTFLDHAYWDVELR